MESSDGLEVIEITCPSNHMTFPDNDMDLPNDLIDKEKQYGGQKFVHHIAENAPWDKWRLDGFEARDVEINAATNGIADVKVARPVSPPNSITLKHTCPMLFSFVLAGSMTLNDDALEAGDSFVMPPERQHTFAQFSKDLELLEVALPAGFETIII